MNKLGSGILSILLGLALLGTPVSLPASAAPEENATLKSGDPEQNLAGELRKIQREIAALRADLDQPGLQDVFAGIGYIFGLFGAAALALSRRRKE